jgi:phage terminase small subunit
MPKKPSTALTPPQAQFVAEYLIDNNGTRAWRATHPECKGDRAAAACASRALTDANVRGAVSAGRKAQHKRLQMEADEALMLISQDARADPTQLFDDDGQLLPIQQWPESVRRSLKSIKFKEHGIEVTMNDSLKARELMAQAGGKLKQQHVVEFDLGLYLGATPPEGDA